MQDINKNWYAVITADVLYHDELSSRQKLLIAVISNLSNGKGYCFATNRYFSDMFNCTDRTIQRDLEQLEKLGFVGRWDKLKPDGTTEFRALSVAYTRKNPPMSPLTSVSPPPDTSVTHNNKYNIDVDKGESETSNTTSPLKVYVSQLTTEYTNGSGWIESLLMNNRMSIKTPDAWRKVVLTFAHHQKSHEAVSESYREFKSHFRHWVAHNSTKTKNKDWYL